MKKTEHDLLARRLAAILTKFNIGERLTVNQLAEEFNVHRRTILRDLEERFAYLPLEKIDGEYALSPAYLGKLSFRDIERFAQLAGVAGLFPALNSEFFKELFDSRLNDTLEVHAPSYEDLCSRQREFNLLRSAISQKRMVAFTYHKSDGEKSVQVCPYRLINNAGIWYLAATDAGQPKSYTFTKISHLSLLDEYFDADPSIDALLNAEDSIWLNEKKTEVVLTISPPAAQYFRRRKLISHQVIEKELEDGGVIVSGKFAHPNQILPIVRYWLPHVRIVSPTAWQDELNEGMQGYLNG